MCAAMKAHNFSHVVFFSRAINWMGGAYNWKSGDGVSEPRQLPSLRSSDGSVSTGAIKARSDKQAWTNLGSNGKLRTQSVFLISFTVV